MDYVEVAGYVELALLPPGLVPSPGPVDLDLLIIGHLLVEGRLRPAKGDGGGQKL